MEGREVPIDLLLSGGDVAISHMQIATPMRREGTVGKNAFDALRRKFIYEMI